jgi:thiamine pyrophosphate-dependent acetolactate synthase large subunit-like protein
MTFHAAMAKCLVDLGVDTMFGLVGDGNVFMVDRFIRAEGGRYVGMTHEAGAVLAANGYSQLAQTVGVATVTHGPGLTNTVTSLIESVKARSPIVVIAGDTATADKYHLQKLAQREIVTSTGAGFEPVRTTSSLATDLSVAFWRAARERRPIVVNVPYEFLWSEVDYVPAGPGPGVDQALAPDPAILDRAVGLLATARRPIVLAGRGAVDARDALIRLSGRLGAPLATTLKARDLFRDEPTDIGIFGSLSHDIAAEVILAADCVVAFGASLNRWTTADGAYLSGKSVVQVDIGRDAFGPELCPDVAVLGDAVITADMMTAWLDEGEVEPASLWAPGLPQRLAAFAPSGQPEFNTDRTVDIRTALIAVEAAVPRERNLVFDGGRFVTEAWSILHAPDPRAFLMTVNFGSIGLGMGTAIGAATARTDRPTLLVSGDGGFMLGGLVEFATACREGLDLIVVVLNDGSYGAEYVQFRARGMDPSISMICWPELAPVAEALGGEGATVRTVSDLDRLEDAIASRARPFLIDVKLDPAHITGSRTG